MGLTKKKLWVRESGYKLNLFGVTVMISLENIKKKINKIKTLNNEQKGRVDTKSGHVD